MSHRRSAGDEGDTLIELLVAIVIISLVVAAILGAVMTATKSSVASRSIVNNGTLVKSFIEQAEYSIEESSSPLFTECATPTSYSDIALGYGVPSAYSGYTVSIIDVKYWKPGTSTFLDYGNGGSTTCQSGSSPDYKDGVQEITAVATTPGGGSASLTSIVRNPTYKSCYATSNC